MVEQLQRFISQLQTSESVSLFLIAKMDEFTDKWTILLSLSGSVDQAKRDTVFKSLWDFLNENLSEVERATIARIGIFGSNESLMIKFSNYLLSNKLDSQLPLKETNFKINGNYIHEAVVISWDKQNQSNML